MELNKIELCALEVVVDEIKECVIRDLDEMQLALVGGGIGETTL